MAKGNMNARERIEYLLDDNSFVEIGKYVTARNTDYNLNSEKAEGDGVITGYGVMDGRMVYVYSQDASVLGGSVGEMHAKKIVALYDLAMKTGAPVIGMIDCAGIRLQEASDALEAFGNIFAKQGQASGKIVQISAVFGMCGGGCAVMSAMSDFTFMERKEGSLFINSPNTLDNEKLNSAEIEKDEIENIDFVCDSEEELLTDLRELVSILPSDYESKNFLSECSDDLNRVIPELNDSAYDAQYLLKAISDDNLFVQIKKETAKSMVIGFIKLNGETIGVVANQSVNGESVLETKSVDQATRFIKFCDAFSIPILTVTDVEGMKTSREEERKMARILAIYTKEMISSTVPKVNLIVGKAFGTAGVIMNSKSIGADFVLAWPQASIGMMDPEQAVRIMYAREIEENDDQIALINEKTVEYAQMQNSAESAAKRGAIDDIIIPDATRKRLIMAYEMLYGKKQRNEDKKHTTI